jgi:hypothetical protein
MFRGLHRQLKGPKQLTKIIKIVTNKIPQQSLSFYPSLLTNSKTKEIFPTNFTKECNPFVSYKNSFKKK